MLRRHGHGAGSAWPRVLFADFFFLNRDVLFAAFRRIVKVVVDYSGYSANFLQDDNKARANVGQVVAVLAVDGANVFYRPTMKVGLLDFFNTRGGQFLM